uniref:Uncharacterized protein n=1 Tax=Ixodes ricinus TaxID=34613 RepID=A0A6B0UA01_IXORI
MLECLLFGDVILFVSAGLWFDFQEYGANTNCLFFLALDIKNVVSLVFLCFYCTMKSHLKGYYQLHSLYLHL